MKKLIIIFTTLISLINTNASESLFIQGNEEYINENYEMAISLYDSIISNGFESSELFYNLGNCYYKKQDWANAIWYYEKSLKQNAANENASYNLEITNLKIIDRIEAIPQLFYKIWWKNIINLFSTKTRQILAIICTWAILIVQLLKHVKKIRRGYISTVLNLLTLILFATSYSSYEKTHNKMGAIVFSASVVVNSAPTENSTNLFTLHSGTKVELIDQIGKWINIKIANGNNGWIKESHCKILD